MIGLGVHELRRVGVLDVLPGLPTPDPHPEGLVHREVETRARPLPKTKAPLKEISQRAEGRARHCTPPRPEGGREPPHLVVLADLRRLVEGHEQQGLVRVVPLQLLLRPSVGPEEF